MGSGVVTPPWPPGRPNQTVVLMTSGLVLASRPAVGPCGDGVCVGALVAAVQDGSLCRAPDALRPMPDNGCLSRSGD